MTLRKEAFENILEKGENAGNKHFLLFTNCFSSFQKLIQTFELHLFCHEQMISIWISQIFHCYVKNFFNIISLSWLQVQL